MSTSTGVTRYCFYNPKGGIVSIRLKVGNQIIAGSDFKLVNESKTVVLEQLKISAENNQSTLKRVQTLLKDLSKANLAWAVVCCSKDPEIYSSDVKIEIIQDEHPLKMNYPAEKHLVNIPPCKTNSVETYKGSLVFMPKE
jgi:hypothetical protein